MSSTISIHLALPTLAALQWWFLQGHSVPAAECDLVTSPRPPPAPPSTSLGRHLLQHFFFLCLHRVFSIHYAASSSPMVVYKRSFFRARCRAESFPFVSPSTFLGLFNCHFLPSSPCLPGTRPPFFSTVSRFLHCIAPSSVPSVPFGSSGFVPPLAYPSSPAFLPFQVACCP